MRREVRQLLRGSRAKMYRPIERTAKLTRLVSMGYTFAQACALFAKYFKRGLLYRNRRHKRALIWEGKRKLKRHKGIEVRATAITNECGGYYCDLKIGHIDCVPARFTDDQKEQLSGRLQRVDRGEFQAAIGQVADKPRRAIPIDHLAGRVFIKDASWFDSLRVELENYK